MRWPYVLTIQEQSPHGRTEIAQQWQKPVVSTWDSLPHRGEECGDLPSSAFLWIYSSRIFLKHSYFWRTLSLVPLMPVPCYRSLDFLKHFSNNEPLGKLDFKTCVSFFVLFFCCFRSWILKFQSEALLHRAWYQSCVWSLFWEESRSCRVRI